MSGAFCQCLCLVTVVKRKYQCGVCLSPELCAQVHVMLGEVNPFISALNKQRNDWA